MANGKKKQTKGKGNNNQAIKNARAGKKGDGLYYYREGVRAVKARRAAVKSGAIEQTPERKKVRELQGLKNKKASKAAKAQLKATGAKYSAHSSLSKATRAERMKKADKLQKKADRKYKRVTGKSPVEMNGKEHDNSKKRTKAKVGPSKRPEITTAPPPVPKRPKRKNPGKGRTSPNFEKLRGKLTPFKMNAPITTRVKR